MEEELAFAAAIIFELQLLDPAVRSDQRAVRRLLASDFTEIGRSGQYWDRQDILDSIGGFESSWGAAVVTSGMQGRMLADDLVMLTYVAESRTGRARRSAIWRQTGQNWTAVFQQATPLAPVLQRLPRPSIGSS